jgi:hypothetical protein
MREAMNLDGGGSSVMVVRGAAQNHPSDEAGERPVVNALALVRDFSRCAVAKFDYEPNVTASPSWKVRPGPGSK